MSKIDAGTVLQKLQPTFSILEMEAFPRYQRADKEGRDRICQEIAQVEAKMIMDEIHAEVERRCRK